MNKLETIIILCKDLTISCLPLLDYISTGLGTGFSIGYAFYERHGQSNPHCLCMHSIKTVKDLETKIDELGAAIKALQQHFKTLVPQNPPKREQRTAIHSIAPFTPKTHPEKRSLLYQPYLNTTTGEIKFCSQSTTAHESYEAICNSNSHPINALPQNTLLSGGCVSTIKSIVPSQRVCETQHLTIWNSHNSYSHRINALPQSTSLRLGCVNAIESIVPTQRVCETLHLTIWNSHNSYSHGINTPPQK